MPLIDEQAILTKVAEILNDNSKQFGGNLKFEVAQDEEDNTVIAAYNTGTKRGITYADGVRGNEVSSNGTMDIQFVLYADLVSESKGVGP